MNRSDSPKKQPKPFGVNGQRVAILPTTPAGDNSASYEQGFPPITMILKSAGGLPPKGQDMNQILYELSALGRWSSTGALNTFDSEFASEISGYPSGAMLISDDGERIFINTTEGNLSDPNSNGAGWKDVLSYLGLGEGSALPVGVPVPWPSATPPIGWLKCNGATFSAEEYPELAKAYPTNKLPDLRGEFIRGWDDGRGVDSGRTLLSSQGDAIRNITGNVGVYSDGLLTYASGVFSLGPASSNRQNPVSGTGSNAYATFDASKVVPTANENRPRNIAFNYIVRAA
ncbi:phage tail protein [Escherichia coli]|uniref:phage tail protein n=1 Tax=Escherichia coli TaxID=562 RepID=UPI00191B57F8|nr:putative variable tail fiber protein [Escherichia coli]CAD6113545.1 putative variable tail fiber protein [Escherichia coli]